MTDNLVPFRPRPQPYFGARFDERDILLGNFDLGLDGTRIVDLQEVVAGGQPDAGQ